MRRAALAALLLFAASPAAAMRGARLPIDVAPAAGIKAPLRTTVDVTGAMPAARGAAWIDLAADTGAWQAVWDRATGVPSRIWGGSVEAPLASASPGHAEAIARSFVERHLALLAPGSTMADLELVSNHSDGRIRSIGFVQRHAGLRVVGGQLSVRFLADRLYFVSSQALPDVRVALPRSVKPHLARHDQVIVPLVSDDAVLGYRVAAVVDAADGWRDYADPETGDTIVRADQRSWGTGTLVYDAPVRWPGGERADYPAANVHVSLDGLATTSATDGVLTWSHDLPAPLVTSVVGELVAVQAGGDPDLDEVTAELTLTNTGVARWSVRDEERDDAQLTTFVHTQVAKAYARSIVTDPDTLAFVDAQIAATVNINDSCNAFYDRTESTINFFIADGNCENTGRLPDVVYHEYGHGVHHHSVIEGVGFFDPAMSEGVSDFFAGMITGDPAMGVGFRFDADPLRHLDPSGGEATWPEDIGEIHKTGEIIGGALWDLRTALIAALGEAEGVALTGRLFVAALQRATDIPTTLLEILAADDDNGDLSDGTPHECLIREQFGRHGLRTMFAAVDAPGAVAGLDGETTADVVVTVGGLSELCLGDEVDRVEISWDPRFDSTSPEEGEAIATAMPGAVFVAALPLPDPGDVVDYRVRVVFSDGTAMEFPDNRGDPDYELYRGELVELYCTDFEADPFADGWSHGSELRVDPWAWGVPGGAGGDPATAYSGDNVVGMALADTGLYENSAQSWLRSPVIDIGNYSDVRLQYRRWLGVEDGFYDQARILADGQPAWVNFDSGVSLDASTHTRDKEWVFKDVPLSTHILDQDVQVQFDLTSDEGLEFGGWTIDDLCVVADPNAVCGDGTINGAEQCDAGDDNADVPDRCRVNCRRPACGDGIVDGPEACDDGNTVDDAACDSDCSPPGEDDPGCCSTSSDPEGALGAFALFGLVMLGLRRRAAR